MPGDVNDNQSQVDNPSWLLYSLCQHILSHQGKAEVSDATLSKQFQYALRIIGSRFTPSVASDEFQLCERIKRQYARHKRESDAAIFSELYRKIQGQKILQNRWAILYLLHALGDISPSKNKDQSVFFGGSLPAFTSTPHSSAIPFRTGLQLAAVSGISVGTHGSSSSSGISSRNANLSSLTQDPTPRMSSFAPRHSAGPDYASRPDYASAVRFSENLPSRNNTVARQSDITNTSRTKVSPFTRHRGSMMIKNRSDDVDGSKFEVTEQALLRDIVLVFQGIEGKFLKFDIDSDAYRIDPKIGVPIPVRDLVNKLSELGWLFRKVRKYLDARVGDKAHGLVGQSFCFAIKKELTEYFRLLAILESQQHQLDQSINIEKSGEMTLRRLIIWTFDPLIRMKALAVLVDLCKGKKGGALLSAIYSNTQVGDPYVRNLIQHILDVVSHPVKRILERWIFQGDLQDQFHEFFVAADPAVRNERLWHEKYSLRKAMIPSFISASLATKILNIGKSINMIRVVCEDRSPIGGYDIVGSVKVNDEKGGELESVKVQEFNSSALQEMIDVVYKKTGKHLLEVLFKKYNFIEHLQAMRRYLLLGQGDFIRHLMDLLESDLAKPANTLYMHNLTGVLETAIRATNAQYDDPDILKRLDCRLLEVSPGDRGWDVFSLDYHVDGPISTVFTPDCMFHYLRIFNFLWRAKRMEYGLTGVWKTQMCHNRALRGIAEIAPLLHQSNCLEAEMVHFIHQMQYYITFEVLECCWEELLHKVQEAEDLDHIIAAHERFLDQLMVRALLDESSKEMLTQLRAIFDLIIQFQNTQASMFTEFLDELHLRQKMDELAEKRTNDGQWGLTEVDIETEYKREENFQKTFIPCTRAQLRVLHQSYQDMLQTFLAMLNGHSDVSLRFLCFRLDFNEHYKRKDPKLRSPMSLRQKRYAGPGVNPYSDIKL